jgi:hypothetical protein
LGSAGCHYALKGNCDPRVPCHMRLPAKKSLWDFTLRSSGHSELGAVWFPATTRRHTFSSFGRERAATVWRRSGNMTASSEPSTARGRRYERRPVQPCPAVRSRFSPWKVACTSLLCGSARGSGCAAIRGSSGSRSARVQSPQYVCLAPRERWLRLRSTQTGPAIAPCS